MDESVLSEEYSYYAEIKEKLLEEQEGRYALIKKRELVGVFDTDTDAYQVGAGSLGMKSF